MTIIVEEECIGCGLCVDVCPVEAITLNEVAHINPELCTECGSCIEECPNEAIKES